jgi:hypothetical protein
MKPLIVFHSPCMDGAAAALAAWLKFGDEAEYRPAKYGDAAPADEECRGRDVYVLDFSYPRAELVRMRATCGIEIRPTQQWDRERLVVLDHHISAQRDLAGLPFCTFDMMKSGAALAWERFHTGPASTHVYAKGSALPELFAYIQDRDLWQWKLPHSREISAALAARECAEDWRKLIPIWQSWQSRLNTIAIKEVLIAEGAAILRAQEQQVARAVATAEEVTLRVSRPLALPNDVHVREDYTVRALAVSCPLLQSDIGEALALESARRGRDAVGVVYFRDGAVERWRVSLRSRSTSGSTRGMGCETEAPDVSAIAKSHGGGGHVQAAGFECSVLPWL